MGLELAFNIAVSSLTWASMMLWIVSVSIIFKFERKELYSAIATVTGASIFLAVFFIPALFI